MRFRRLAIAACLIVALVAAVSLLATPYITAASLIVRAAHLGGTAERLASSRARPVSRPPRHTVPTRHGDIPAQFFRPAGEIRRTVLLIPGINSMGLDEPRLNDLATQMAASGLNVMMLALPDLMAYRITPNATDVIEDAIIWMAAQPALAPDGRVGVLGISFAGGLSIVAAGRPAVRDKLAFVSSFGGHADLPRVMRYLATGEETTVAGVRNHTPHDYGVAVILYGLADRGVVPEPQVQALREGISIFLLASQETNANRSAATASFARARAFAGTLPEPSRTYLGYVNDRDITRLGRVLLPHLNQLGADDPAISADRALAVPAAPVYLLHGEDDTVIPAAESAILAEYLRGKGADVHLLLSGLITHAGVNPAAAAVDVVKLVAFWGSVLRR